MVFPEAQFRYSSCLWLQVIQIPKIQRSRVRLPLLALLYQDGVCFYFFNFVMVF